MLDLSNPHSTGLGLFSWSSSEPLNLAQLPATLKSRDGTDVDLWRATRLERGTILKRGRGFRQKFGIALDPEVQGIEVDQTAQRIHSLTAAKFAHAKGTTICKSVMYYEDGTESELPIKTLPPGIVDRVTSQKLDDAVLGSIGPIAPGGRLGGLSRLSLDSPHPDKVIQSINFIF